MRAVLLALFPAALLAGPAAAQQRCPVPGQPVQWIADYCMAQLETDDEIAASACIERELARAARGDKCREKLRYKRELCRLWVARGTWPGDVAQCERDARAIGRTVRQDQGGPHADQRP